MQMPFALVETGAPDTALRFETPRSVITARHVEEIEPALAALGEARRAGYHLVGHAAFELGYWLEPALRPFLKQPDIPFLRFGVFSGATPFALPAPPADFAPPSLSPVWSLDDYTPPFEAIIENIRAGNVYQVNLTFPLEGRFSGDPLALYARLRRAQPTRHGALLALGDEAILSFSPELFFEIAERTIRARPMKGTAARGANAQEDADQRAWLAASIKDRAENLMIVDLMRNDLGRLAEIGSVHVTDLFTIEPYPTLFQMTSGIEARLRPDVALRDVFTALFPCGSVTGAPKIRAMALIARLESRPRNVYCGSIAWIAPDGAARFNVVIRTLTLLPGGRAVLNVGSGIVYDSLARTEYEECLLKARFFTGIRPVSG
jgi:aminodeoxychorismate synthase component I